MGLSAQAIRSIRVGLGLSQDSFAGALGVARNTVVAWENGHNEPSPVIAARLVAMRDERERPLRPGESEKDAAYAAGVLWGIAQDAEHIARKAREAHLRLTGREADPLSPSLDAIEEGAAALRQPPAAGRRRRTKG